MGTAQAADGRERSHFQRRHIPGAEAPLPEGIPERSVADNEADAKVLYQFLRELGGEKLVGPATELAPARSGTAANHERYALPAHDTMTRHGAVAPLRGPLVPVLSVAGFLLVWFIAAEIAQSRLLPGPGAVLQLHLDEAVHGDLLTELGITLWRVRASFVVAMAIGSVHRASPWARCRRSTGRSIPG